MSKFIIVSVPGSGAPESTLFANPIQDDSEQPDAGCAWLFSAAPRVDDPEEAVRAAVREYFATPEGERVRAGEGRERWGWCEAIGWVPDGIWERHGLSIFRHPDVERIILDEEEDLAEELTGAAGRGSTTRVAPPPSA